MGVIKRKSGQWVYASLMVLNRWMWIKPWFVFCQCSNEAYAMFKQYDMSLWPLRWYSVQQNDLECHIDFMKRFYKQEKKRVSDILDTVCSLNFFFCSASGNGSQRSHIYIIACWLAGRLAHIDLYVPVKGACRKIFFRFFIFMFIWQAFIFSVKCYIKVLLA